MIAKTYIISLQLYTDNSIILLKTGNVDCCRYLDLGFHGLVPADLENINWSQVKQVSKQASSQNHSGDESDMRDVVTVNSTFQLQQVHAVCFLCSSDVVKSSSRRTR